MFFFPLRHFQCSTLFNIVNIVQHSYEHCFVSLDHRRFCGSFEATAVGEKTFGRTYRAAFGLLWLCQGRGWIYDHGTRQQILGEKEHLPKELGVRKFGMKWTFNTSASAYPSNVSQNMLFDKKNRSYANRMSQEHMKSMNRN